MLKRAKRFLVLGTIISLVSALAATIFLSSAIFSNITEDQTIS